MAAIYPNEWRFADGKFTLEFKLDYLRFGEYEDPPTITFAVHLPPGYPRECPPVFELRSPWVEKSAMNSLSAELEAIYL
jgi:hypothetical protein